MSSRYLIPLAVAAALAAPVAAQADVAPGSPKGDWIFRVGMSQINPKSDNLPASESALSDLGPDLNLVVDSDVSPTLTVEYMLTEHLGTELLLAYPFTHAVDAKAGGEVAARVGSADVLPPVLSLNWHFNPNGTWRPYIGVGVNYTMFSGEEIRDSARGAIGDLYGVDVNSLSLDDSIGVAGQVGIDVSVAKHWLVNASVR